MYTGYYTTTLTHIHDACTMFNRNVSTAKSQLRDGMRHRSFFATVHLLMMKKNLPDTTDSVMTALPMKPVVQSALSMEREETHMETHQE